jgi:anaerobic ribonucleoside-triphosphate reductase activating protein
MKYANIKYYDVANGPGVRTSLFVSGCTHRCEGCFNEIAWDFNYGDEFNASIIDVILDSVKEDHIAGITLLGGEPMEKENQAELIKLLRQFKKLYPEKTVWCYTGYTYEEDFIQGARAYTEVTKEFLKLTDVLVDGKFIISLMDIRLRFRGSSNQRIIDMNETRKNDRIILWDG